MKAKSFRFQDGLLVASVFLTLLSWQFAASAAEHWENRATGISRRTGNSAVWTGRDMIVWGGGSQSVWLGDGGSYNLDSNRWRVISQTGAPSPRWFHGAVWTGKEMLVWGGRANFYQANTYNNGGRYDPDSDSWRSISATGAPASRSQFPSIWTGKEMLVWGGWADGEGTRRDGGRYDPETDTWRPISGSNAPSSRVEPTAVWTGTEMIIFGGIQGTGSDAPGWVTLNTGGRYNPETDTWTPLPTEGAPSTTAHTAVWTGTDMIIWGGRHLPGEGYLNTGARYNLAENKWYPLSTSALAGRGYHAAVWTGSEMLIWGGLLVSNGNNTMYKDGARYNPATDSWTAMTQENAPQERHFWRPDLGIWTGHGLLFYGGSYYPQELDSTAYYIPPFVSDAPASIFSQPHDLTVFEGRSASFKVVADGSQPISYQWYFAGNEIDDATNATLQLSNVQLSDAGLYSVSVSNSFGSETSREARLTVTQPPPPSPLGITGFSPASGPTGTVVTITGRGFSSTANENVVYFGTMLGAVSSETTDSITATVPAGATFAPIAVTANGLTARSASPFQVTFPGGNLDAGSFNDPISFSPGDGPVATVVADLDGDGQPDLAIANLYSENVVIYSGPAGAQNGLSSESFSNAVEFPTGSNPWDFVVADLDGDGKLDLIFANINANTVSILRNISTPGHLAFAERISFPVGNSPHQIAVGDLDGDGHPDLVTANFYSDNISVLRNTTQSPGTITFDSTVNIPAGVGPHGVGIADLDGDGMLDVVVTHHGSSPTLVLRNLSLPGQINADSLPVAAHLPGDGTWVTFGDLDADGKLDLIIPSWYEKHVSIFKNLSSLDHFDDSSFGSPIVLSSPGSVKRAAITDLNGDGRLDIAFPSELDSALSFYMNLGGSNELSANWFGPRQNLPAGWNGDGISIGDLDLDGRPEIVFCNFYDDTVFIYRWEPVEPPAIVHDPQSQSIPLGSNFVLSVEATGAHLQYHWFHDGELIVESTGPTLSWPNARPVDQGEYFVIVQNSAASVTSQVATITIAVERALRLGDFDVTDVNEGDLISLPLQLSSLGDVGGMDLTIYFDADALAAPEVHWDSVLDGALKESSLPDPNHLHLVIALPATTIPAGTQTLATVQFRARTVLHDSAVGIGVGVIDLSDDAGDPIPYGTTTLGTTVNILDTGSLAGDNNANHRLDVGDASLLMRLIAQLDTIRDWDVPGNDLNANQRLDSGDVIKMLRIIAGIDPPPSSNAPSATGLKTAALNSILSASSESALLSPGRVQASAGQLVTFQLRLTGIETPISGASFRLNYPVEALRLQSAQSHRVGPSVPSSALAVWNVAPGQNNYATQTGQITLALSGPTSWNASDAVLAEFTFEVQPGAANRYQWPVALSGVELTGNGYNNRTLAGSTSVFIGRNPVAGSLVNLSVGPSGVSFTSSGDAGADYRIDASEDLVHWTTLQQISNHPGSLSIDDPAAATRPYRFYRSVPVQ